MTYDEVFLRVTKRRIPGEDFDIEFTRRLSWPPEILLYHGWISSDKSNEYPQVCVYTRKGTDYYTPTERDLQANDWTLDVWDYGEMKVNLSYFDIKKMLKTTPFAYAGRKAWDDEHAMLAYNLATDDLFLTDFGSETKWEPTVEDIETKDWWISRYLL